MYRMKILLLVTGITAVLLLGCSLTTDYVGEAGASSLEDNPVKTSDRCYSDAKRNRPDVKTTGDLTETEETADVENVMVDELPAEEPNEEPDSGSMASREKESALADEAEETSEHAPISEGSPGKVPAAENFGTALPAESTGNAPAVNIPANSPAPDKTVTNPLPDKTAADPEEESPSCYKDSLGNIRCERIGDTWYEYIYSTADVTLGLDSTDRALFFLNWDGSYDDYEVYKIECEKKLDNHGNVVYAYHVTYVKKILMDVEFPVSLACEEELYAVAPGEDVLSEEIPLYCFKDTTADHPKEDEAPEIPEEPENPEKEADPEKPAPADGSTNPIEEENQELPEEDAAEQDEDEKDISEEIVNKEGGTLDEYDAEPDIVDGFVRTDNDAGLF